ncbi:MAG: ATP phosphoribosyltransferase [Bacteroidales bacterium]|nr:ATP phosphoribosyltransferase [Bacteroidales bacterium]
MLRIAIQSKGRLFEDCMDLLKEAGIKLSNAKRTLLIPSSNFPVEVLYLRDDDIPECVANGVADVGIVGLNEFSEREKDAKIVKELGFSKCRLSLAIPALIDYPGVEWFNGKTIATSYPNILRRFLDSKGVKASIHVITGSVEISPNIGLGDGIFDIVSSGSTLVSNRLKEVEVVVESQAVLIANNNLDAEKQEILEELLFRFDAVRSAEDKKYVMMNVPDESLEAVISMLPGVKAPTVIKLATDGWHAVHTVISEKAYWQLVGKLKAAGAEGILALNIEKMVL